MMPAAPPAMPRRGGDAAQCGGGEESALNDNGALSGAVAFLMVRN